MAIDDIHQAIGTGDGAGPASRYRFVANVRHRYERVSALPDGLLVAGDALCSFNPIYGQGMSVAALEARQLRQLLRDAGVPTPAEWFATVAPTVAAAWELATGADLALPDVVGRRSPVVRIANAYLRRLHAAAARDPVLATRFVRVAALLDPPSALLRPVTIARVLRHHLTGRGRGGSPS